jgi:hypothetical protein
MAAELVAGSDGRRIGCAFPSRCRHTYAFHGSERIITDQPTCQGANLTDPLLDALAIRHLDLRTRAKHCFNERCRASHPAGGGQAFSRPRRRGPVRSRAAQERHSPQAGRRGTARAGKAFTQRTPGLAPPPAWAAERPRRPRPKTGRRWSAARARGAAWGTRPTPGLRDRRRPRPGRARSGRGRRR